PTGSPILRDSRLCCNLACRPHLTSPFLRNPVSPEPYSFSLPIPRRALPSTPKRLLRPAKLSSRAACKDSLLSILIPPRPCFLIPITSGLQILPCSLRKRTIRRLPIQLSPIQPSP